MINTANAEILEFDGVTGQFLVGDQRLCALQLQTLTLAAGTASMTV